MATETQIYNLALGHVGVGKEVAIPTEASQEAKACRRFYDISRKATLRDFPWPLANKYVALGLVKNNPTRDWSFSYQMPSDCLHFLKILSGIKNDTRQTRVPYEIVYGTSGTEIYSNRCNAVGKYTVDVLDTSRFPDDLTLALSLRLAAYIAPRVTAGDPFKMGQRAMDMYDEEIMKARATAANEEQEYQDPASEFVRDRTGYGGPGHGNPDGTLFGGGFLVE